MTELDMDDERTQGAPTRRAWLPLAAVGMPGRRRVARRRALAGVIVGVGLVGLLASPSAQAAISWANAQEVPGTATLNGGGKAGFPSVSCASAGNCSAGGYYTDANGQQQAFMADEVGGVWGSAQEVPGTAALNADGSAQVNSVSCASAGNCSAGGFYLDGSDNYQAFVVDEVGGVWGSAQEVPGTAALNAGGYAAVNSVSCASAGNCSAGGFYQDGRYMAQVFVVDEVGGVWGSAQEVPGTAALNADGNVSASPNAMLNSVSCGSAGNCSAGGYYTDGSGNLQAFVADEVSGVWADAQEVPGTATLNAEGYGQVWSVSCASAGDCSAGGQYKDGNGNYQAFVVDEVNGVWGDAQEAPGTASLNVDGGAQVFSVSCTSPGNCSAGGYYSDGNGANQAFVMDEVGGTWGNAQEIPGTATLNAGGDVYVNQLSCASAGNCAAGGSYVDGAGNYQAFVVEETGGVWGSAEEVPGTATLNAGGNDGLNSVSCASADTCSAGGYYTDGNGKQQVFMVDARTSTGLSVSAPASGTAGGAVPARSVTGTLSGGDSPTGSITFKVFGPQASAPTDCTTGGSTVGTPMTVSGNGTYNPSSAFRPQSAGDYWWYASYSGDASNNPAVSTCEARMAETVVSPRSNGGGGGGPSATRTSLSASPDPGGPGQTVSYTATVSPAPGGGAVRFTDDEMTISGCAMVPVTSAGTATCYTTYGAPGSHSIGATFSGGSGYAASNSPTLTEVIRTPPRPAARPTMTALSSSPGQPDTGQRVRLTATVSPVPDGGTVGFTVDGRTIAACAAVRVSAAGMASCQTVFARAQRWHLEAYFTGFHGYDPSSSSTLTEVVRWSLSVRGRPSGQGRRVGVELICARHCGGCHVTLVVTVTENRRGTPLTPAQARTARHHHQDLRTIWIARRAVTVKAGRTGTATIDLDRAGRRLAKAHDPLPATLTIYLTVEQHRNKLTTRTLTIT